MRAAEQRLGKSPTVKIMLFFSVLLSAEVSGCKEWENVRERTGGCFRYGHKQVNAALSVLSSL